MSNQKPKRKPRPLTAKQRAKRKAQIQAQKELEAIKKIPLYQFPNVLPLISYMHHHMPNHTPLKIASTLFLTWAIYAGITEGRPNVQLFIPWFNADPDLGVICRDVYKEERRHKFDYMKPQPMNVDPFTKQVIDLVLPQADALSDEEMIKITKTAYAYQYAIDHHQDLLEPYLIIGQYTKWVNYVYAQFKHQKPLTNHPSKPSA